ncbi:AsnC family transcriptional regulator [Phaeovulum sp.]|uniref:siroheme decarboxylase subunit beta n=1 Tax=Phaeovulum sp. TaxID=2934796 RepID=UPI0039E41776
MSIDAKDRAIIKATQSGLPLVSAPYAEVAGWLGLTEAEVIARMSAMQTRGIIRRIALAPNHYALGLAANGMSVWDIEDDGALQLGAQIAALPFVTHCYLRARKLPEWPYNLFAMIHGTDRDQVTAHCAEIAAILGPALRSSDVLFSTRLLKKSKLCLTPNP